MCSLGGKVKGKVHPLTGHKGPEGGTGTIQNLSILPISYTLLVFLTSLFDLSADKRLTGA